LLVTDDEEHKEGRRVFTKPLHGNRMHAYDDLIEELTHSVIKKQLKKNKIVNMREFFAQLTMQIIFKSIFGLTKEEAIAELSKPVIALRKMNRKYGALGTLLPQTQINLGPLTPYAKFIKLKKQIHDILDRQYDNSVKDGLDILSLAQGEYATKCPMAKKAKIRDQMMTFLFAGQNTTTQALLWIVYWMSKEGEELNKLQECVASEQDI